jgi:feruloyl esterase
MQRGSSFQTRPIIAVAVCTLALLWRSPAEARALDAVKPVVSCESLTGVRLLIDGGVPARIASASYVAIGNPSPYCAVKGYVAPQVNFEIRLPTDNWTQRLLFAGCGGFCGQVRLQAQAAEHCQPVESGELAVVATDMGHSAAISDAVWAAGNQPGRVDFGYRGVHVVTLAAKQIIARFYGQSARYAYFSGCSDGGGKA